MIFKRIYIFDGQAVDLTIERDDANLTLNITKSVDGSDNVCVSDLGRGEVHRSTLNFSCLQAKKAIERILSADGFAEQRFHAGATITRTIPDSPPLIRRFSNQPSNVDSYSEARQSSVALARPLFLPTPSLELLYPFQKTGVDWLLDHPRGLLADDMGLGKTIQTISAMRQLFNNGDISNALVVCPTSLTNNWERELMEWAPELSFARLAPSANIKNEVWKSIYGRVHVIITNYEHLRDIPEVIESNPVDLLICDESHRIRNFRSQVAIGIRGLQTKFLWALSGTPLERDKEDLIALLVLLAPTTYSIADRNMAEPSLRAQLQHYMLRRLKSDVLSELPEVIDKTEEVELLPLQREAYNRAIKESRRGNPLQLITRLRQICDYEEESEESSKIDRTLEIINEVRMMGEKAIIFSYLLKPIEIIAQKLQQSLPDGSRTFEVLTGDMQIRERDAAVARFKNDPGKTTLLCSSRIGGEGLNLTEANHVIFLNEWWNPAANAQARDRVHRIGQEKGVRVYRFRCAWTIEQALSDILDTKEAATKTLVDVFAMDSTAQLDQFDLEQLIDSLNEV